MIKQALSDQAESLLITEIEAGHLLGCSGRTVYELRKQGKLKAVRVGGLVKYARTEIERFINDQMDEAQEAK